MSNETRTHRELGITPNDTPDLLWDHFQVLMGRSHAGIRFDHVEALALSEGRKGPRGSELRAAYYLRAVRQVWSKRGPNIDFYAEIYATVEHLEIVDGVNFQSPKVISVLAKAMDRAYMDETLYSMVQHHRIIQQKFGGADAFRALLEQNLVRGEGSKW